MTRAIFIGATLAALSVGSIAHANEHTILVVDGSYFPTITYLDPGDTVRFVNATDATHNIIGKNDAWSIELEANAETTMVIEQSTQMEFYDADSLAAEGEGEATYQVAGSLSFAAPPMN